MSTKLLLHLRLHFSQCCYLVSTLYVFHRFRVIDEIFVDITPAGPDGSTQEDINDPEAKKSPYTIIVSLYFNAGLNGQVVHFASLQKSPYTIIVSL